MNQLFSPAEMVRSGLCIGCGSCVAQANTHNVQMQWDVFGQLKPGGSKKWLHQKSEIITKTCPFSPESLHESEIAADLFIKTKNHDVNLGFVQTAYVGHVAEQDFRMQGSSGGMVTWVAAELLRLGWVDGVAHVVASENPAAEGRFFYYKLSSTEVEIRAGAKSRYYPIELSEILKKIRETPGRYAIIGIPCFIKSVQLLRRADPIYQERIKFTLGLFCGHLKSARFVESFAWQLNVSINDIQKVEFRYKDPRRPANWYKAHLTLQDGTTVDKDWWHLADGDWGAGFFMNAACNYCDDVVAETADIAFGDAWVEPYTSDGRGTNVVVVRSSLLDDILKNAIQENRLVLEVVDNEMVVQTQAAGFRQRREGLAYRLTWARAGVQPRKRVMPDATHLTRQRKFIYRMRHRIATWSHRVFWLAHLLRQPWLYLTWARLTLSLYHGFAYHEGKWREILKRFTSLR